MDTASLNKNPFFSGKKFYDYKNFPNFFHRSGDFTIKEADVLTATGDIMTRLCSGNLSPSLPEHEQFLQVVNGNKQPETLEEKVYLKYLKLIDSKDKIFPPVKNNVSKAAFIDESDNDIGDYDDEL